MIVAGLAGFAGFEIPGVTEGTEPEVAFITLVDVL